MCRVCKSRGRLHLSARAKEAWEAERVSGVAKSSTSIRRTLTLGPMIFVWTGSRLRLVHLLVEAAARHHLVLHHLDNAFQATQLPRARLSFQVCVRATLRKADWKIVTGSKTRCWTATRTRMSNETRCLPPTSIRSRWQQQLLSTRAGIQSTD